MFFMDTVFKALSDDTRRALLDALHDKSGQTLTELEASVQEAGFEMTRFGVMKHLRVLEAASLVISRKEGRFKFHYLNAVPLQQVIDRWIEPLTQKPVTPKKLARAALDLKAELEGENVMSTSTETKPDFMLETYIKTTPQALWEALTNGEISRKYFQGDATVHSDFTKGADYKYVSSEGNDMLVGTVLDVDPMKRLEMTFAPVMLDPSEIPDSRNVYEIEQMGDTCKLTILHYGVTEKLEGVKQGWSRIAARLKTLLETGDVLTIQAA